MKTYVILGGGGVFGIHTALYLLEHANPKRVISVGRNPEKPEPFSLNVGRGDDRYEYQQIHVVHEQDRLFELFDRVKPEVVVSYAAQGEGAASWKRSWRFFETNTTALVKMSEELMSRSYLQRFIQIGTSELYGSVSHAAREDDPIRPTSVRGFESGVQSLLDVGVERLEVPDEHHPAFERVGPGQQLHRVVPRAVLCGLTGRRLPLQGGGRAEKSYIHANLAHAVHLVAEKAPLGRVYNAGPAEPISIRALVEKTADALGIPFEQLCEVTPDRLGQDSRYWLDSSAIRNDVGWEPRISLDEGLRDMVDWGRRYLPQLADMSTEYVLRA